MLHLHGGSHVHKQSLIPVQVKPRLAKMPPCPSFQLRSWLLRCGCKACCARAFPGAAWQGSGGEQDTGLSQRRPCEAPQVPRTGSGQSFLQPLPPQAQVLVWLAGGPQTSPRREKVLRFIPRRTPAPADRGGGRAGAWPEPLSQPSSGEAQWGVGEDRVQSLMPGSPL